MTAPDITHQLSALARAAGLTLAGDDVAVTGLSIDSRRVRPGDLFVALPGTRADGLAFIEDARARGAAAVCAGRAVDGLPTLVAGDVRVALSRLSSAWWGDPAHQLRLVGITGTLGKTSTAQLVLAALGASGRPVGVVGSLGVQVRGSADDAALAARLPDTNAMTTPDAPTLHQAFRLLVDAGVRTVAMEVTSHALAQRRVAGLVLQVGAITNLVPDEHLEFHPDPMDYLRTKAKFFDHLEDGAPIVANADDALVRDMVQAAVLRRAHPVVWVSTDERADAAVQVHGLSWDASGSRFTLAVRQPIPLHGGATLDPVEVPLVLPVFGVQQVENAALAATVALVAGASPQGLAAAVASVTPMRRRMQVLRAAGPTVVDDTSGNPQTLRAVFESVRVLPHARLRVAFGIRGTRGPEINRRLGRTLGELVRARAADGAVQLVVTASEDAADARNRVLPEEREAFHHALVEALAAVPHRWEPTVAGAVAALVEDVRPDDLLLVLGAQGMDTAGARVLEALASGNR